MRPEARRWADLYNALDAFPPEEYEAVRALVMSRYFGVPDVLQPEHLESTPEYQRARKAQNARDYRGRLRGITGDAITENVTAPVTGITGDASPVTSPVTGGTTGGHVVPVLASTNGNVRNVQVLEDAKEVLGYCNQKWGTNFRPVGTNLDLIASRIRHDFAKKRPGLSKKDCENVVDFVTKKWGSDPRMRQYLRISTVFRASNFEQYLGQLPTNGHDPLADAKTVLAFLNEKTGRSYREEPENLEPIAGLLRSGVTVGDCKGVIARKWREWKDDPKMREFARPATLFAIKYFEQYLGQRERV